ncbi:MAG: hypothetical protein ACI9HK_003741, partial [Pirellulaceae bacterium]
VRATSNLLGKYPYSHYPINDDDRQQDQAII